jgi:putative ABC transport system permease protein
MIPKPLTPAGMICRNLYRQPLRTSLTVLGVAIGVISMVAITAVVRGMWAASQKSVHAGGTDLLVFQSGVAWDVFSVLDEAKTRTELLNTPGVESVAAALTHMSPVEGKPFFIVFGIHCSEFSSSQDRLVEGRLIQSENEAILGRMAQSALKKKVGDHVTVSGKRFNIVGVFESDVVFYSGAILIDLPALQKITKRDGQVSAFQVKVKPGVKPQEVGWKIEKTDSRLVAIGGATQFNKVGPGLDIFDAVELAVAALTTIIGGLIVLNTMWMSVHERTREIGVLRALGWSKRGIVAMILAESAGVGMLAAMVGMPLGFLLANMTTRWAVTQRFMAPVFDVKPVIGSLAVGLALSMIGGVGPAWRAARISPVEALRYE